MNTRQAESTDNLLLSTLSMDVQRLHAEYHPEIFKIPQTDDYAVAFFNAMLADPLARIFIAEDEKQAIGYALCKVVERAENPFIFAMRYLLVDQISVRPESQGKGAGKALIDRAVKLAEELNLSVMELTSWDFNTNAHVFFESTGFEKCSYRFWRKL